MNLKNKKYLCIIPARAGSQGIKNKNIKILDGMPLVQHTIKFSKKIENYFDVVVATNPKKVLSIAKKYQLTGLELRPENLSGNNSLTIDVVKYELNRLEKKNKKKYEAVLLLQPTVPYRRIQDINIALKKIQSTSYDSVVSIKNVEGFHPLRMKIKKKKYIVNYSSEKKENMKPRQKLPKVFLRSGSIYMIKRRSMINLNSMVGQKVYGLEQSGKFTINIDTNLDLFLAKNKNKYL